MTSSAKTVMSAGLTDVANNTPQLDHRPFSDPSRLAPEDAFVAHSPPHGHRKISLSGATDIARGGVGTRRRREKVRGRSGSRRRKGTWKKLLWVKQNCMTFHSRISTKSLDEFLLIVSKTQTTTQILQLSFRTSNEILDCSHTISGH